MSDSEIQVDLGTGGVYVDTSQVSTSEGQPVQRQRVAIGDASAGENFLGVGADGASSVHVISTPTAGSVSVNNFPATQVVSGSVSVINETNAPASVSVLNFPSSTSVAGSVSVNNFPSSFIVSNLPAIQPVSQASNWGASISNFPANQTVSGSVSVLDFPSNQVVSGSVGVTNFPGSFIVSNFPATQAVSGSVTAIPTGVQAVSQSTTPWAASVQGQVTVSGSVQALPSSADIGYVGTWATAGPICFQTSSSVKAVPLTTNSYPSTNGILVQGLSTNIASVFVGATGVASVGPTGGFEIQPGQAVPQTCGNASLVFIVGPNNTDSVCWTVL